MIGIVILCERPLKTQRSGCDSSEKKSDAAAIRMRDTSKTVRIFWDVGVCGE